MLPQTSRHVHFDTAIVGKLLMLLVVVVDLERSVARVREFPNWIPRIVFTVFAYLFHLYGILY